MNEHRDSFLQYVEAHNFQEMMEAIPFKEETRAFVPLYSTLILFVSDYNYQEKKHKEKYMRIEKTMHELCHEAEENVKWILELKNYRRKFVDKVLFLIVRLSHESWCKSEFQKNDIVNIRTLPTLMWFDEPFVLEGVDTTNLMIIKEFFDIKLKLLEIAAKFLPAKKKEEKEEEIIEFKRPPKFRLEFWDLEVAAAAADEAEKRVKQVQEGVCNYDVMMDVFTKMKPCKRKQFLKELDEATPDMLPFRISTDRYSLDEDSNLEIKETELELDKPNVKEKIIAIERFPTPEQRKEKEKQMIIPPKEPKNKGKKGKGKKGKEKKKKGKGKVKGKGKKKK